MPNRFPRLAKELAGITLWEGAKLGLGVLLATSGFAWLANFVSKSQPFLSANAEFVYPIVILGGLLSLVLLYERVSRYRARMPTPDFEFLVVSKSVVYEYHDLKHMTYKKSYRLRALRRGLQAFPDRYSWTGHGSVDIRSSMREQTVHQLERGNVWHYYEIRFGRTLSKGEEVDVETVWTLDDAAGTAVPFVSADIVDPTDKLTMTVVLPHDLGVREVIAESSAGAARPYESKTLKLDGAGRVEWHVEDPKLFHHYELRWVA